jgi:hypothetical protein
MQPLLDARARYRAAQSELAIAQAALRLAQRNHERLARLHSESIIATRELNQAESQLAADQARAEAAGRHIREIREETLHAWGLSLFQQVVQADSPLSESLLDHSSLLVLLVLPATETLPPTDTPIRVAPAGQSAQARPARLLSAAPRTEEATQGETWLFAAQGQGLRAGMRLDAWLPQAAQAQQGVALPRAAVVWSNGLPWAYVQTQADYFERRPIALYQEQGEAWFVPEGFAPGEKVVASGGQMLLSEEIRRLAPTAQDDD